MWRRVKVKRVKVNVEGECRMQCKKGESEGERYWRMKGDKKG